MTVSRHPATTTLKPPDANGDPIGSLPPTDVSQPCPESNAGGGGQGMLEETSRLEPMLGQVLAYGSERPDQFGSYGLLWLDADDASVFVSFTSNIDEHRAALEASVEHPDELIVCQVAVSDEVAQAVEATLVRELDGRFLSIGRGGGAIEVVLAANEELLASELIARYGDAIEVTVGALAYPLDQASEVCEEPPAATSLPGLRIDVVPPAGPVSAAGVEPLQLTVVLTNEGSDPISFVSGTARATILDLSGTVVSSASTVLIGDVGTVVDLRPGASTELAMVVTTASCDPRLGYVLPPGNYQLIANVQHSNGDTMTLTSSSTPIVVG